VLGTQSFPTTIAGYRRFLAWLRTFGARLVGVEGTGNDVPAAGSSTITL